MAAAFVGDGGTSEGDFHEAVNLAAVWKLPVIFVVENNQYGLSTPVREQFAVRRSGVARRRLRHPRRDLRRQRPARGAPRDQRGGGARPARRRSDPDRVQDLPDARPRGGVGHRLRPAGAVRRVARAGSDRALRAAARRDAARCRPARATRCASSSSPRSTRSPIGCSARPSRGRPRTASSPTSMRRRRRSREAGARRRRRDRSRGALRRRDHRRPAPGDAARSPRRC